MALPKKKRESSKPKASEIKVQKSTSKEASRTSKKSERGRKPAKALPERQRSQSSTARLAELCPEDKAKIGELVKKLAGETKEKIEQQRRFDEEKRQME